MDAIVKPWPIKPSQQPQQLSDHVRAAPAPAGPRPTREQAEEAVRTLIAYAGDDPAAKACWRRRSAWSRPMTSCIGGYRECPAEVLDKTFAEIAAYDDFVLVRDIAFNSHCEHHMMPFFGKAHVAYRPVDRVVGLSKLARLVDVYARRLQTQEHMTAQIATAIDEILQAARRRGDDRGRAYVHVDARRGASPAR